MAAPAGLPVEKELTFWESRPPQEAAFQASLNGSPGQGEKGPESRGRAVGGVPIIPTGLTAPMGLLSRRRLPNHQAGRPVARFGARPAEGSAAPMPRSG
jgi:hypothetical protein